MLITEPEAVDQVDAADPERCGMNNVSVEAHQAAYGFRACPNHAAWTMACRRCGTNMPICDDHRAIVRRARITECGVCGWQAATIVVVAFLEIGPTR